MQEISYARAGDISTESFNPLRDTVFLGNQEAYGLTKDVFIGIASSAIPIGFAGESIESSLVIRTVARETASTLAGAGAAQITREVTDNKFLATTINIAVSMGLGLGLTRLGNPQLTIS